MQLTATYTLPTDELFADRREAILTDEHAASSYDIPVVVADGVAYGPAEFPHKLGVAKVFSPRVGGPENGWESDAELHARITPECRDLIQRARAAGYQIEMGNYGI